MFSQSRVKSGRNKHQKQQQQQQRHSTDFSALPSSHHEHQADLLANPLQEQRHQHSNYDMNIHNSITNRRIKQASSIINLIPGDSPEGAYPAHERGNPSLQVTTAKISPVRDLAISSIVNEVGLTGTSTQVREPQLSESPELQAVALAPVEGSERTEERAHIGRATSVIKETVFSSEVHSIEYHSPVASHPFHPSRWRDSAHVPRPVFAARQWRPLETEVDPDETTESEAIHKGEKSKGESSCDVIVTYEVIEGSRPCGGDSGLRVKLDSETTTGTGLHTSGASSPARYDEELSPAFTNQSNSAKKHQQVAPILANTAAGSDDKARIIGSIMIAEYDGSPRRYRPRGQAASSEAVAAMPSQQCFPLEDSHSSSGVRPLEGCLAEASCEEEPEESLMLLGSPIKTFTTVMQGLTTRESNAVDDLLKLGESSCGADEESAATVDSLLLLLQPTTTASLSAETIKTDTGGSFEMGSAGQEPGIIQQETFHCDLPTKKDKEAGIHGATSPDFSGIDYTLRRCPPVKANVPDNLSEEAGLESPFNYSRHINIRQGTAGLLGGEPLIDVDDPQGQLPIVNSLPLGYLVPNLSYSSGKSNLNEAEASPASTTSARKDCCDGPDFASTFVGQTRLNVLRANVDPIPSDLPASSNGLLGATPTSKLTTTPVTTSALMTTLISNRDCLVLKQQQKGMPAVALGHHPDSRNFTLSPETTDCDSADLESEVSINDGSYHSSGPKIHTSMPVLEDGLSSGHASDLEEDALNPR